MSFFFLTGCEELLALSWLLQSVLFHTTCSNTNTPAQETHPKSELLKIKSPSAVKVFTLIATFCHL